MKKIICNIPITIIGGFIILSLINFIFRSMFNLNNLIILISVLLIVFLFRRTKLSWLHHIVECKPVFIFLGVSLIGIFSMLFFNPELWDDPLNFHNQALVDLRDGTIKTENPYSIRGFLYIMPIYKIFGTNIFAVKIINFIIYLLTGFLFFRILQINFNKNRQVITLGIILFYAIPFFSLAINIPHWDLISTLYLMLSLFILSKILIKAIEKKVLFNAKLFLLSILLGISFTALFYTRGLSTAMLLAFIIFSLLLFSKRRISIKQKTKVIFYSAIIPLLFFFLVNASLSQTPLFDKSETNRSLAQMIFSYNDTRFDGTSEHRDKKWVYIPELPKELRTSYAFKKLNSEINYNWHWYMFRLSSKNKENYSISGLNNWILHDSKYKHEISRILNYWEFILQLIIIFFAIIGFIGYFNNQYQNNLFLLFTIAFIFTSSFFSLISEANNRYSLIFVYGLIIFAVLGIQYFQKEKLLTVASIKPVVFKLFVAISFFLMAFFGYRQLIAKNYCFEQLKENNWRKAIGKINLTAFQKQLNEIDNTIKLNNSNNDDRLSFFIRTNKNNIGFIQVSIASGDKIKSIEIEKDNFVELLTAPKITICFFNIDISEFTINDITLDFSGSNVSEPLIIEYLSFY